jgi:periplasmic protein TonB
MPVTGAGLGAAGAFMTAAPAGYALSIDLTVPTGPAPPAYALAAGQQRLTAATQADPIPYRAAAAAFALHVAPVALYFAVLALLALFFAGGEPQRQLGTEDGLPENLNVSIISEAELNRLHSSASRQDQSARPGPLGPAETPSRESQEVLAPPQPPMPEAEAAQSSPQPRANANRDPSFDPSAFIAMASQQFSNQLNQAFSAAEARRQASARQASTASGRVRSTRPGATHLGKSDEFERAVIWALGATVPEGNGKWGSTIVTFTVSAAGQPDGLHLLKSSGDNWLDTAALMAVKQARIPSPPPGLPAGDRTFVIEYISLPSRSR